MIYFTLPNFIDKINVNKFIKSLFESKPEILKIPVQITGFSGSIPYSIWNGSINNNYGKGWFYSEIINFISTIDYSLRLDASNLLLEEKNFFNTSQNFILQNLQNSNTQIEISNLKLFKYLKEKYNNYFYVFSDKANLIQEININIINTIIENKDILFMKLPKILNNNIEVLNNISIPSKIEIIVNDICPFTCNKKEQCIIAENKAQLEFSKLSCFNLCEKIINPFNLLDYTIPIEKLEEYKTKYNINRFSFEDTPVLNNDLAVLNYYLNYFVKSEYYSYAIDKWLKVGKKI